MIANLIHWSIKNRLLVLLVTLLISGFGLYSVQKTPVDAIPDLSDVQVIVKTSYPGQAPQVVEEHITYPISSAMLSVPGAHTVRGFSFFGDSYVYIIFDDNTDIYWARSRVLEYLSQVSSSLPPSAKTQLGPDASGVGWVYMYALSDESGKHSLADLTSIQNWFLKYELQTQSGVAEVATVGGMVKQYQVIVDPMKLQSYQLPLATVHKAIEQANQASGASVIEIAEAEYMVTTSGYLSKRSDIENIPVLLSGPKTLKKRDDNYGTSTSTTTPLLLKDIARVEIGPQMRRGVAELDGRGESVGGIVVMRHGENAQQTINAVKNKLKALQNSLPDGVKITTVYDRSALIERSIDNLTMKLLAEFAVVSIICIVFLFHLPSSFVAIISLPIGILVAFSIMHMQGINANIMSLGGIAIAIGAMIDGAIVLVENMHKHIEKEPLTQQNRWKIVAKSASEVGPALFFSLLIITVSFIPVFTLEAQEGRMFTPLAYTKTYAMAAAAILAVTLVPVLMGYFVRGNIRPESTNPLNKALISVYRPILRGVLHHPKLTLLMALVIMGLGLYPLNKMTTEFIPPFDEGDLMYMPSTYPSISVGKARQILQQTNKLIKTLPEVEHVFGKVGRADTATDPAPLTMIESNIKLKPKSEWRDGLSTDDLIQELDALVDFPGITNAWVMPIKTRIDMLATGIKTPIGIKISGPDLATIQHIGEEIESTLSNMEGSASVYAERSVGGRYIHIDIDRVAAARFNISIAELQKFIASAVGGRNITTTVEGLERYPVQLRFAQSYRDSPERLAQLPYITATGAHVQLSDLATINIVNGPAGIKSENARPSGWVYIDIENIDVQGYVDAASTKIVEQVALPPGYSISFSGQFEYMQRAKDKLSYVIPLTLGIIVLLLYLSFKSFAQVTLILVTLPLALIGGLWLSYLLDFSLSVAVGVGFIALAGVAVEIGIILLSYLDSAYAKLHNKKTQNGAESTAFNTDILQEAIIQACEKRIRPIMMTSTSIIFGLLPVLFGDGAGSELMSRIAAPMVGGMISALFLSLIVLPVLYYLWRKSSDGKSVSSQ
ncbi:efflux RND transporter permease subunit [Glaciecola sp. MH2013]|uniref:efflux RND transporter permease subunit n=1 Tax=Glaciecola sp. MH2013 TaxID=2785524 RepID=UPI0018A07C50|nr:CusA/CzcA family heavy metal efflux RND transporter [Glaciecola sp. MH2013]MBF7073072.1 efflux RND transporter permease subunit [Glaciecola sp. MH2013]